MKKLIIDAGAYEFIAIGVRAKEDRGDNVRPLPDGSFPQKYDRDGSALWVVECLTMADDQKSETVEITVAGPEPKVGRLTAIEFTGLVGTPWLNNGRAGVALRAESVRPKGAPKPSHNGTKAPESAPAG